MKRCCTSSWRLLKPCRGDRLTSLPDELLGRILSLLPTKDVAVTQVLCKRMGQAALSWITSVDLDDYPVSHCQDFPRLVDHFPLFKSFIVNVLKKLLQSKQSLTRFRLRLGGQKNMDVWHDCKEACYPVVEPAHLNMWISYPLTHCGLRELDLSFHLSNRDECKLPPGLFTCQSLKVLKLDFNIKIDDGADIPLICLPSLKLLQLRSFVFTEDDFLTRLVSRCPALEDLSITSASWVKSDRLTISSHSLRRLSLDIRKWDEEKNSDLVLIDTPNLHYLNYYDNLPHRYSIARLNALVEAHIEIAGLLRFDSAEDSFRSQLGLLRALSNVQNLSLLGYAAEIVCYAGELKDQLPVFPNLRTLELGATSFSRWDVELMLILHCSPLLETLVFPEGLFYSDDEHREAAASEAEGWRRIKRIPSCFLTHLKRIELKGCFGIDRELNTIKFLLGRTSVLKEMILCMRKLYPPYAGFQFHAPNLKEFVSTIEELPRASNTCFIIVQ